MAAEVLTLSTTGAQVHRPGSDGMSCLLEPASPLPFPLPGLSALSCLLQL